MTALPLSKRVAALMAAGAVAAACGIVAAMPAQAHAATNLTLDNVKNLPFYDAGHTAAKPVWKSTSKVIAVGGCKQCASIWYDERAWDIQKAGNGILLSDVGTDLDGDPYDIKIVAKSVKGVHTDKGTVSYLIQDASPRFSFHNTANSECSAQWEFPLFMPLGVIAPNDPIKEVVING